MGKPIDITEGVKLTPDRRSGNTTRIVDNAIQLLFGHGWIKVEDHYTSRNADRLLMDRILGRLYHEHPGVGVEVNLNNLTIKLKR